MNNKNILPYSRQWIDESDIEAVTEVLRSDYLTTGSKVEEFENKVAGYCGAKYAVAVSSGTAALHCACYAAGIDDDSEVITTPNTFMATVASIIFCGGVPVLVDIDDTLNIDPDKIEEALSDNTRAIMPVDFAGHPADLERINSIARRNGLVVIEDACHALGAEYKGRKVGSLSDMTVFSFHPVKAITTGEGGMVLTDDPVYNDRLRLFRNHNIKRGMEFWQYHIEEVGYNYRLTDIQCALGISQLSKLDSFIDRRREIASMYDEAFKDMGGITIPTHNEYVKSAYHLYPIRIKDNRNKVAKILKDDGIEVQIHYKPLHLHGALSRYAYKAGDLPEAEKYYDQALSIPLFPKMTDGDVERVIEAVQRVVIDNA